MLVAVVIGTIWVVNRLPVFIAEMRAISAVDDPVMHRRLSKLAHDMRKDRRVVPLKWKRRR